MRDLRKWGTLCLVLGDDGRRAAAAATTRQRRRWLRVRVAADDADKKYVLGISNTLVGNGFREEMICAAKAQALASGKISEVVVQNQNGGAPEQIAAIRNLISAGANAIVANPADAAALNPVIADAEEARTSSSSPSTRR